VAHVDKEIIRPGNLINAVDVRNPHPLSDGSKLLIKHLHQSRK
jgi:hypothetical protein